METSDRILAGARDLFFKYGIKSVTMDDIARHLGVSKKTIYQFYTDKNELLLSLCKKELGEHAEHFCVFCDTAKDAIDEIFQTMKYMAGMFSKINPSLFYDMKKYHPKAWEQFREFKEKKVMQVVEANINKGIEQGLYRNTLNPKILARLRIEEVDMAMNPEVFPSKEFSLTEVQVALLDHFLYGILTLKGHRLINKYKQITEEED
jgi:AcrR family transcriptional regulator